MSYEKISPEYKTFLTELDSTSVPKTVNEALASKDWKRAMDEEMMALKKNGTWDLTPLPKKQKLVGCRWVYTQKFSANGKLERCKARVVAKGYTQREGIDYVETFAPVAKFNTVRILIALASKKDWSVLQFDVKNAFLHGELEEEVYMTPPPGYQLTPDKTLVCRLKKALYGLKQSPRAWFAKFARAMKEMNYYQSNGDNTLFMKHGSTGKVAILIVYVDDILLPVTTFWKLIN